ncbi:isocitrate/isopropylmalate dehydrogenase family protein [Thalassospira lucentensis]|uniref:isocitrate/isopropylmalate dehydrogenase family protein n=1 Tax=Thalassospira lucentensis TaxID=168935 RepID=UPI003D2F07BC
MTNSNSFNIAVFPGDGIGEEITTPCVEILQEAISKVGGFSASFDWLPAGAGHYRDSGQSLPKDSMAKAAKSDAILLAAMGLPDIRYPDGTEISPQIDLRFEFGLYAGVRPVRTIPGLAPVLNNPQAHALDFVIIRESTEGLFASHGKGTVTDDAEARDTLLITRDVSERLFDFSLNLGRKRKNQGSSGVVTCVDKANVFKSFAFFRKVFDERAALNTDVATDHMYVDAAALNMVRRPWDLDVLVTENMFGDILSDLGAGLIGGMGFAPSADIGDEHAVFQPCHGSAPDIAGKKLANPTAMFLSGAMMLEWLGDKHGCPEAEKAGAMVRTAVDAAFANGDLVTGELGGKAGTTEVSRAVMHALKELDPARHSAG